MTIAVSTIAPTLRLTTRARVQEELGSTSDGALIDALIDRASAAIASYCHRPFAREAVTETCGAFGGIHLDLSRTPIVGSPSAITYDGTVISDATVADAEQGILYRRLGWAWTAQRYAGLSGSGRWFDQGSPLPGQEEPLVVVDYVGGYILPPQNVIASTTISAAAADNSFNDSASGFPALLKAGDIITVSGFATAGNNGRFVVSGTPTTSKIVVTASLTLEAAGLAVDVIVQSLPYDVEKAAIEAVKSFYARRQGDSSAIEKQVGPMRIRYSEGAAAEEKGLPPVCVGLLRPYVRSA